ncbi:hypothetical protein B1B04_05620 [Lysinibacillus sp. KCTC 33748]|uniref:hypothetical protein n=1 Tax=unclassified Lysinibacillus TaxID=2636778 RepID=UPI0009A75762|nr:MULTISPECIES: hypothetical protein [unclassified Lysinibacillus]OXS76449.1 hypothetical protein B1B04_05620 [Lysinibacillus sp. KCTC 33748]SKB46194.1 hypothetical protein SAMN06295926_102608 [Lysinibacillus sp. AC-3]
MYQKRMEELQKALYETNIFDYQIDNFDGDTLVLLGSFDLAYYYEIKLTFKKVDYINCPSFFDIDRIRLATEEEKQKNSIQCQLDKEDIMIVFDVDVLETYYFIICQDFEYEMGLRYFNESN